MIRWFLSAVLFFGLATSADAMTFRLGWNGGVCDEGCQWVAAVGEITSATPKEFARFVATLDPGLVGYTIYFNSTGGDLTAGMRLGEMIRARKLTPPSGRQLLMTT